MDLTLYLTFFKWEILVTETVDFDSVYNNSLLELEHNFYATWIHPELYMVISN